MQRSDQSCVRGALRWWPRVNTWCVCFFGGGCWGGVCVVGRDVCCGEIMWASIFFLYEYVCSLIHTHAHLYTHMLICTHTCSSVHTNAHVYINHVSCTPTSTCHPTPPHPTHTPPRYAPPCPPPISSSLTCHTTPLPMVLLHLCARHCCACWMSCKVVFSVFLLLFLLLSLCMLMKRKIDMYVHMYVHKYVHMYAHT